jgi:hypothetical protein
MNRIVKIIILVIAASCVCIAGMVAGPIYYNAANSPTIYKDRCEVGTCGNKTLLLHPQSADRFSKPYWWFGTRVSSCSDENAFGPRELDGTITCYVQRLGPLPTDLKVLLSLQDRTIGVVLLAISWPLIALFLVYVVVTYFRRRLALASVGEQTIVIQHDGDESMRQGLLQQSTSCLYDGEAQFVASRLEVVHGNAGDCDAKKAGPATITRLSQQEWLLMSDGWLKACLTVLIAIAIVLSIPSIIMGAVVTAKSVAFSNENQCKVVWCANQNVAVIESQRLNRGMTEAVQLKRCDKYVNDPVKSLVDCFLVESAVVMDDSHLTLRRPNYAIGLTYLVVGSVLVLAFACVAAAFATKEIKRRCSSELR